MKKNENTNYLYEWRLKHKEHIRQYKLEYRRRNLERIREYDREYNCTIRRGHESKRKQSDLDFKIRVNLRTRLYIAIKNNSKAGSAVKDLGCSIEEFKIYITTKFVKGMTWNNWGIRGWHLDHIKPLSSFDLTDRKQFLEAVHFTNYQPLWAAENWRKNNRIEDNSPS